MLHSRLNRIFYGGDYNPEQWDESIWKEDMRLMKKARVNLVSVGIFSWSLLQPNEETYDFSFLDKLLGLLGENGIYACLATATAAQPAWASRKYPDMLPVDERGIRASYGSRQSYCPNNPGYRRLARNLVLRIASRYKDHPALLLWHVNNEYGCHVASCYCEECEKKFRDWLLDKYQSLENLNKAWGTDFWSQRYYEWEEIIPPRKTTTYNNPAQVLDYRRFFSDSIIGLFLMEYRLLKEATPGIPVTTNLIPVSERKFIDQFKLARHADVAAIDLYPDPAANVSDNARLVAFAHDFTRGLKNGEPFLLMEQAPNQVNWRPVNVNKRPGRMRLWSYQAIAHGAEGVMFFQWRQSLRGPEKFHSAIVNHAGDENSRVFKEVEKLGEELGALPELLDTRVEAKVALLFDFDSFWAVENDPCPSQLVKYMDQILLYHKVFFELNIPIDIASADHDLTRYALVIAPLLYLVKPGLREKLEKYVSDGGIFITTFFSGIVDENDAVFPGGYPGALKTLLGVRVEEFDPLPLGRKNKLKIAPLLNPTQPEYACELWCELVHLEGAQTLAFFTEDYYQGEPAVTVNSFGNGKALYIATQPEPLMIKELLNYLKPIALLENVLPVPLNIEAVKRTNGDKTYLFILNHGDEESSVNLDGKSYRDLLTGLVYREGISLPPCGVAVLRQL